MDHYADDLAAVTAHLDLRDAVHVGHSTGYHGFPHGMPTTQAQTINADLLAWLTS